MTPRCLWVLFVKGYHLHVLILTAYLITYIDRGQNNVQPSVYDLPGDGVSPWLIKVIIEPYTNFSQRYGCITEKS